MEKKRVMIVDDEKDFLTIVKMNLEKADKYTVMTLSNAKDIISQIHAFKPDVILLDLLMPSIGGIEVCEMLNKDPLAQKIPVIIVSALEKRTDKLKAYKLGVTDYIVKPVEIDELVTKIEKALSYKLEDIG